MPHYVPPLGERQIPDDQDCYVRLLDTLSVCSTNDVQLTQDLDEAELAHTLEALGGVVEILERRSDELVAAIILRDVIAKILRAIEESR